MNELLVFFKDNSDYFFNINKQNVSNMQVFETSIEDRDMSVASILDFIKATEKNLKNTLLDSKDADADITGPDTGVTPVASDGSNNTPVDADAGAAGASVDTTNPTASGDANASTDATSPTQADTGATSPSPTANGADAQSGNAGDNNNNANNSQQTNNTPPPSSNDTNTTAPTNTNESNNVQTDTTSTSTAAQYR